MKTLQGFVSVVVLVFLVSMSWATVASAAVFGIIGDAGIRNASTDQVRASLLGAGVTELVLPGDNLYDLSQTYDAVWGVWHQAGLHFPIVALGNHSRSYADEIQYFEMPGEFYSRRVDGVHFIVLNSDNRSNVEAQLAFLNRELESPESRYVFVVFHHPPFTISDHHSWKEKKEFQQGIRAALRRHASRITALIVGHDHMASLLSVDGIPLIVSGATHEHLSAEPISRESGGFRVETRWLYQNEPTWAKLSTDPETKQVGLDFVRARDGSVSCTARIAPLPIVLQPNCAHAASLSERVY